MAGKADGSGGNGRRASRWQLRRRTDQWTPGGRIGQENHGCRVANGGRGDIGSVQRAMAEETEGTPFVMMIRVGMVAMMHGGVKAFVGRQGAEQQDPQGHQTAQHPQGG